MKKTAPTISQVTIQGSSASPMGIERKTKSERAFASGRKAASMASSMMAPSPAGVRSRLAQHNHPARTAR